MVSDTFSLSAGTVFEYTEERYEGHLVEESDRTDSPTENIKAKVLPFPRKREGELNSENFELGNDTREAISSSSSVSESSHSDSGQIPFSSKGLPSYQKPSNEFLEIMKMHILNPIFDAFDKVQPYASSADAAVYVNKILHTIRQMEDRSPEDPFLDVLFALYDALAFNNNWTNYTAEQYSKAKKVLEKYSKRSLLDQKDVEKAIIELEDIGFDTTPFILEL